MTAALRTVQAGHWDVTTGWRFDPEDIVDDTAFADPEDLAEEGPVSTPFPVEE